MQLWKQEVNNVELMECMRGDTVIYVCTSKDVKVVWKEKSHGKE